MILHEFEVKRILEQYGIPTEQAALVGEADVGRFEELVSRLKPPYVVKAQVRGWGRGRMGLVRIAGTLSEAKSHALQMLGATFRGERVRHVMVSEKLRVVRELYLSMMVGGSPPGVLLLASSAGGIEVEEAAGGVLMLRVDPYTGLRSYHVRRVAKQLNTPESAIEPILRGMYKALWDYSLTLLELNPLAETERGLVAVDRKAIADTDSGNPRLAEFISRYEEELGSLQLEAKRWGFAAVKLEGDVAVVGNGAGLTLATLDAVAEAGGRPGLFLDLGGGAAAERVKAALKLVLSEPGIRKVLVNIVGGITRCDEVAKGVVEALREAGGESVKLVVRLTGFMEEEGRRILSEAGVKVFGSLEEAVSEVVGP
ncbi:MAG: succinate--CoA ligase subunit beta [Thermofilaceae archaeon]